MPPDRKSLGDHWTDPAGRVRGFDGKITVYQDLNKQYRCGGCFQRCAGRVHNDCRKKYGIRDQKNVLIKCLRVPGGRPCGVEHPRHTSCPGCGK